MLATAMSADLAPLRTYLAAARTTDFSISPAMEAFLQQGGGPAGIPLHPFTSLAPALLLSRRFSCLAPCTTISGCLACLMIGRRCSGLAALSILSGPVLP